MEYYSAIKKNAFESVLIQLVDEVDETEAYYTEWSKLERKTPIQDHIVLYLTFFTEYNIH